jgi:hypothetical protein
MSITPEHETLDQSMVRLLREYLAGYRIIFLESHGSDLAKESIDKVEQYFGDLIRTKDNLITAIENILRKKPGAETDAHNLLHLLGR